MELLALARTSKDFRKFFMARTTAKLWETARLNVEGLPDCPPHLSEPAYASLAFDTHCTVRYSSENALRNIPCNAEPAAYHTVMLQAGREKRPLGPQCEILSGMQKIQVHINTISRRLG